MVVPGVVAVACAAVVAPDIAAFAVHHGLSHLHVAAYVVPAALLEGLLVGLFESRLPEAAALVCVPGVDVGLDVVEVAGGVVFHEAGGIEPLGEMVHGAHPVLGLRTILAARHEAPGLVEVDPGEDGGVVVIAVHLSPQAFLPVPAGLGYGLAPEVGGVGHDQEAQLVGPVELAGDFHLDVDAIAVKAEALGNHYFLAHELVAREGVVAFRVVALVEAELEVDGLVVEGDIVEIGAREGHDADFALPEVGIDLVGYFFAGPQGRSYFVEIGVVEAPEVLVLDLDYEACLVVAGHIGDELLLRPVLEFKGEHFAVRGRLGEIDGDAHIRGVNVRGEMDAADVIAAASLEIDGLPYAAGIAIALLTIEVGVVFCVVSLDEDSLGKAELHKVGELELEGSVASPVGAEFLAFENAGSLEVRSSYHEKNPLARPFDGDAYFAGVPGNVALVFNL